MHVWGREKENKAGRSEGHTPAQSGSTHIWATRAHNIHHMAGQERTSAHRGHTTSTTWQAASRSLTSCRIRRDPDACAVLGERKQSRQVRGAHASIACHQHTSGQQGHIIYTIWPGRHTHLRIEGAKKAPHGRQQADHSPAAESGGIQMHVWSRAKGNKAGRSEGHTPAQSGSTHIWATRAHNIHHMAGQEHTSAH